MASTVQMAVLAPLIAGSPPALGELSWSVIGSVVALGVFGSGLAFAFNYHVVRVAGVTTASMVTYLPPVIGAVAGIVVLGEQLTWNQPVGGLIVLAGVAVAQGRLARVPRKRSAEPALTPAILDSYTGCSAYRSPRSRRKRRV
jgi:drug/metabolite transporter (DMT)-like permease